MIVPHINKEINLEQPIALSKSTIQDLLKVEISKPAVTIYIPTHLSATPPTMTEDQIRSKNLLQRAIRKLRRRGDGQEVAAALSKQLAAMLGNLEFWKNLRHGLLICASPGTLKMYYLPVDTEEYVAVDDTFHLAQVFGLLQDAQEYHVIALAQHAPKLFSGNMHELRMVNGVALPETLETALNLDEVNRKSEQQRSAAGLNGNGSNYNGRGGSKDPLEDARNRFWRMLDGIIRTKADNTLPLILAGTASEVAEYRAITRYPHVLSGSIAGNFGGVSGNGLMRKANDIVSRELVQPRHEQALASFQLLDGAKPNRVARQIAAIERAAKAGRIDKLLVGMVQVTTGTMRGGANRAVVLSFLTNQKLNRAVQQTALAVWSAGGKIVNIERSKMPVRGALALATLRY